MTLIGTEDIAGELTTLVGSVPGVNAVYSTKPLVSRIATTVGAAVGATVRTDLVSVATDSDAGVNVLVAIGVGSTEPAPMVGLRVHDAVAAYFRERQQSMPTMINVKIGSVG